MNLLKMERNSRGVDLLVEIKVAVDVFMIVIKAIRNAETRIELWRFCAEFN